MGDSGSFRYRPGCSAPACERPASCVQDRGGLERRHEPGAKELRLDL